MHPDRLVFPNKPPVGKQPFELSPQPFADPHVRRVHGTSLDDQPVDQFDPFGLRRSATRSNSSMSSRYTLAIDGVAEAAGEVIGRVGVRRGHGQVSVFQADQSGRLTMHPVCLQGDERSACYNSRHFVCNNESISETRSERLSRNGTMSVQATRTLQPRWWHRI